MHRPRNEARGIRVSKGATGSRKAIPSQVTATRSTEPHSCQRTNARKHWAPRRTCAVRNDSVPSGTLGAVIRPDRLPARYTRPHSGASTLANEAPCQELGELMKAHSEESGNGPGLDAPPEAAVAPDGPDRAAVASDPKDGRLLLATGSYDNNVRVWDPTRGAQVVNPLTGHTDTVRAITSFTSGGAGVAGHRQQRQHDTGLGPHPWSTSRGPAERPHQLGDGDHVLHGKLRSKSAPFQPMKTEWMAQLGSQSVSSNFADVPTTRVLRCQSSPNRLRAQALVSASRLILVSRRSLSGLPENPRMAAIRLRSMVLVSFGSRMSSNSAHCS